MDGLYQIALIAMIAAIACLVLKKQTGELGVLLSVAAIVLILLLSIRFLKPVLDLYRRLCTMGNLSDAICSPLLKSVGIGFLAKMTGAVCEDAGEKGLCSAVELAGSVLSMYAALPLISAVLTLMEELGQ